MKKAVKMTAFVLMAAMETVIDWINSNIVRRFLSSGCVEKIYSVSIVVGSSDCNANCRHCGGRVLRKDSLGREEGTTKGLKSALALCHKYGGWAVSLTGSGEPLLSPEAISKTLQEINSLEAKGIVFPFINLFTNGIELVNNPRMKEYYLPLWKQLGLTAVAISIHDVDYETNKRIYNVRKGVNFPRLEEMIKVVKDAGLVPRITLLLHKGYCDNVEDYVRNLDVLKKMGIHMVTSWPLCQPNGDRDEYTPSRWSLFRIRFFLWSECERIFNQIWGGGVYNYKGLSARLTTYVSEHRPTNNFIRQLVLFQDGTVAYSWFQEGAFCLK
jgi:MoaA/NifB/PqqE/SkfB family radical SAM enzyme